MLMGVLPILDAYIRHQKEVVTNRSNFEMRRAQKRIHIVEGIIRMMDVLDEVIALIRSSKNKKNAKDRLMKEFKFSEEQSEAIVMLQLYRLSNTDISALQKEFNELEEKINELDTILRNERELEKVIKEELKSNMRILGTPRQSEIEEEIEKITITEEELVTEEQVYIGITREGYVKKSSIRSFRATDSAQLKEGDSLLYQGEASTLNTVLIFTNKGNYVYLPVFKMPEYKWKELGTHINNIVQLNEDEVIIKVMAITDFDEDKILLFTTKNNLVKTTKLKDFEVSRYSKTVRAIALNKKDEVVSIDITDNASKEILIISEKGQALRFNIDEITVSSTIAKGVKGMNLAPKEHLACGIALEDHHDLLILTNRGTIKRVSILDIPKKKRTNRGTQLIKPVKSNPVLAVDLEIMNATQYKNRAQITVNTELDTVIVNAFDIKSEQADNGKTFIKKKSGQPLLMTIEKMEIDPSITPLSEYEKEEDHETIQQTLFE